MDPWDQDREYGLDEFEDFVEGLDDEQDELGIDYTARHGGAQPLEDAPTSQAVTAPAQQASARQLAVARALQAQRSSQAQGQRKARVRPMSPTMAARNEDVTSILVTKLDGSQTLFVRR